jgi:hypothetical protein
MLRNMSKVDINIITRGSVSGGAKREIVNTLQDCYKHFGTKLPNKVDVFIAENDSIVADFLREEKFRLGILDNYFDECICSNDAWRGYPRITIAVESLSKLNKLTRLGALRHEAAHTALHGSLEYGIFQISEECQQIALIKGIDMEVLELAVRYLSDAVKDCETTKFLIEHDYINCQAAYALECVHPPEQDQLSREPIKSERQAFFIYKTSLLRPLLFASPLVSLPKSKKISREHKVLLDRKIEEIAELLGPNQNKLLQVAEKIADGLTEDTHYNINLATRQAMVLA